MEENKSGMLILAIVAIVAVVALVVMISSASKTKITSNSVNEDQVGNALKVAVAGTKVVEATPAEREFTKKMLEREKAGLSVGESGVGTNAKAAYSCGYGGLSNTWCCTFYHYDGGSARYCNWI